MVDFGGGVFEEAAAGFLPAVEEEDGVATEQGGDVGSDDGFVVVGVGVVDCKGGYGGVAFFLQHGGGECDCGLDLLDVVPGDGEGDVGFHGWWCLMSLFAKAIVTHAACGDVAVVE